MASGVPYLKGIRTKFLNTRKSEFKYGSEILLCDRENIDSEEFILKTNKCIDKIQNDVDKLENQTDKWAEKIEDTESTVILGCVEENDKVFCQATECWSDLKHIKEWLSTSKFGGSSTKKIAFDEMVNLQKEMQSMMVSHLKKQQDFLEHQNEKEKTQESTLKFPKLDMLYFSGDKLKWNEFWDSFLGCRA